MATDLVEGTKNLLADEHDAFFAGAVSLLVSPMAHAKRRSYLSS